MRWRFADRIDAFEPWKLIRGRKGISLEEYSLLERFDRPGVMPETLVLETCIHFARWLAIVSSGWRASCRVMSVKDFSFDSEAAMGDQLQIEVTGKLHVIDRHLYECRVSAGEKQIAHGHLDLELIPLAELDNPESLKLLWNELYAEA